MSALTIDTLAASQTLRKSGLTEDQASGVISVLREIDTSSLATKADIGELRSQMRAEMAEIRADLRATEFSLRTEIRETKTQLEAKIEATSANLKVEILRWLVVTQIGLAGFIFAALKLVR